MASNASELEGWRRALHQRYDRVRARTEALAEPLAIEDYGVQSMPDASPTKWHLAHTTWFFETFVLEPGLPGHQLPDPRFRELFNSYYRGVGPRWARPQRGMLSRPTVAEVYDWRHRVDAAIHEVLEILSPDHPLIGRIELGLHHEQQHQELIVTDIKHALAMNPLLPVYRSAPPALRKAPAPSRMVEIPGGVVTIGHSGDDFHYDNEGGVHDVLLRDFRLASRPLSCGDVLAFIHDGGYERAELWLDDGWTARETERWEAPLYWWRGESGEGDWQIFTLAGPRPVDPEEPAAHLSFFEADAIARWAGKRLPTEAEWEHAARLHHTSEARGTLQDDDALHPVGRAAAGPLQWLVGEVWEWTVSAYLPYPGYRPLPGALGEYNGKFMNGQRVLRGGSCATPSDHIRLTYRNFFQPEKRWQFAGVRLAEDA